MVEINKFYNCDCMQLMRELPNKFIDLAIVDPPYGIGIDGQKKSICTNPKHNRKEHKKRIGILLFQVKLISESCSEYQKIKLYLAETILSNIFQKVIKAG